ncbi:hypothetical protein C0993_011909 [Termitomyces sp. T159_Od127]|nr:hypothetical protein C0993_011909 [Termitomyces sp. T159_Od127]
MQDDQPQILDLGLLKLALLQFEVELMLAEAFQDLVCNLVVLLKRVSVDEDVVKVYAHYTLHDEVPKDVIHHCLKSGRTVGESKEHDEGFKQSTIGSEGSLPLVSFLNVHIVVALLDVQFGEVPHPLEVIDELGDEGERVAILHHHGIKDPVVLDWPEQAILLFDEEDQRSHW